MLDLEKLKALLGDCPMGADLIALESVDSTNLQIVREAAKGAAHGCVVLAEQQTAGKGRRGRSWDSPAGENVYFSLLLRPEFAVEKASMLTLVMALAVAGAVRSAGLDAGIKWPNDVVVSGRKVCGILTELRLEENGRYFVLVGVGINVNGKQFSEELRATATSLAQEKGEALLREELMAAVLKNFARCYGRFVQDGDLAGLKEEYEALLVNRQAQVKVLDPKRSFCGTALGITEGGELLVRREDGSVEAVYAGEVSVRGIYGYV